MQDDPPEDAEDEFDGWLVVPQDDDNDMFGPELSEEDMGKLSLEDTAAGYDEEFDDALYKLYTGNRSTSCLSKLLGKCLVPFVSIFLLILIPMILYVYVWWFSRMH